MFSLKEQVWAPSQARCVTLRIMMMVVIITAANIYLVLPIC